MSATQPSTHFPRGILRPELFMGALSSVSAYAARWNLSAAGAPSGVHFEGGRYGRGEVGEYVLIEGQCHLLLGRVAEVKLPDSERRSVDANYHRAAHLDAVGTIHLLGSVDASSLLVSAGVDSYPRIGDRVYAAPHAFVARLPRLMERAAATDAGVWLNLGSVGNAGEGQVEIKPEKLFGRHCAILGATGGGKSWTTARLIEECLKHNAKVILLDPTGEYRDIGGSAAQHVHFGDQTSGAAKCDPKSQSSSRQCALPPNAFLESDFLAMFEPSGKVQGPKMRAAIRSLRLAELKPDLAADGLIRKAEQKKNPIVCAERENAKTLEDPYTPFDVTRLVEQIQEECVLPDARGTTYGSTDASRWGVRADSDIGHCLSLLTRISGLLCSASFRPILGAGDDATNITKVMDDFLDSDAKATPAEPTQLLRIDLSHVSHEFRAREIVSNAIARMLLTKAREGTFRQRPLLVVLDEAHHFLGRTIGNEDTIAKLDAFELIAREGRKYGLNLCLATQRPRDITEGVLSQMGTLIVHRLTNERDREVVERACGEIDRAATAFLPNLKPGEAAIVGADFPIPLTICIHAPTTRPLSDGPNYQEHWAKG